MVAAATEGTVVGDRFLCRRLMKRGLGVDTWLGEDLVEGGAIVVVKTVVRSAVSATARLRFEHEADVLRQLQGGRRLLVAAGHDGDLLYLVQPFHEGATLRHLLDRDGALTPAMAIEVAIQVLATLEVAHAHQVLHRDLKPANIVIDDTGPSLEVVLIDFGLSRSARLDPAVRDEPVGTARYLAPEAAGLIDVAVEEPADLYSLGIVMFESLTGSPPFTGTTVGEVLRQHLNIDPPPLRTQDVDIPRALEAIVSRLLRKNPNDRYQSATSVSADLHALDEAMRRGDADPALTVGLHDRRTVLTEPAFVGREHDLSRLAELGAMTTSGHGGLVLVEAESGGGKTRLLDELALQERRGGSWILRGQGTDQAAPRPFQLLEGLAEAVVDEAGRRPEVAAELWELLGERTDALVDALPVLRAIHPDRPSAGASEETGPEMFGEARSLEALVALLAGLGSPQRPALVLLDDCQWADGLTLRLIDAWQAWSSVQDGEVHTLVVAAFRSEEVGAGHRLRATQSRVHLKLRPFEPADIARLCESMAGPLPDEALSTITRLADGSPFMAAAVLRGMVECGALVGEPDGWTVDAAPMAEVQMSRRAALFLVQRLELLTQPTLAMLSVAAVLGKVVDLDMAVELSGIEDAQVVACLEEARRRRIVWVDEQADRVAFTHDKLREALLERLADDERTALHRGAAATIESRDPTRTFELAYHFDAAGQHEQALPYALESAAVARSRYALEIATDHYRIAERAAEADPATSDDTRARITEGIGEVLSLQGRYEEAEEELGRALALRTDPLHRAAIEVQLGDVAFKSGRPEEACRAHEAALRQLGRWVPRSTAALMVAILWEALVQVVHSLDPRTARGARRQESTPEERLALRILSRLAYAYWFHAGTVPCAWSHLREMNLAERRRPSPELAQAWSEHAPVTTMAPWYGRGLAYAQRSLVIRQDLGDTWGQGQSLGFAAVVLYAASRFEECIETTTEARRLLSRTGDRWEENTATWHLAYSHYRLGHLDRAVAIARELHRDARSIGDDAAAGIALAVWAKASEGRVPAELVAAELERDNGDAHTTTELHVAEGVRLLHAGRTDEAITSFQRAEATYRAAGLRQEYVAPVLPWSATALRVKAEQVDPCASGTGAAGQLRHARRVARRAARLARAYRNNAPHALREVGLLAALSGHRRRARRALTRSLAIAERQGATYEAALTRAALARTTGDAEARMSAEAELASFRQELAGGADLDLEAPELSLADRFSSLLDAGRAIAAAPSPAVLNAAVRDAALTLLRGERCHVIELEGDLGEMLTTASGEQVDELSRSLITRAIETGAPVVVDDLDIEDSSESLILAGLRSALCAPIRCEGEVVACFYVTHRLIGGLFDDVAVRLAEFIAALAGATLEHVAGSEARFRSLAQNSTDVITIVDRVGRITYQSSSLQRVLGFEPVELVGQPLAGWVHPDDLSPLQEFLSAAPSLENGSAVVECRLRHRDGSWRHVETSMNNLLADPSVRGVVLNTRDISDRVELEGELRQRAWHDSLTGLANRSLFTERVDQALARRNRDPSGVAVLFLDLDDFKSINDTLGHVAGDLLLRGVGERLSSCVRPGDTVARFGGDEFAVLLRSTGQGDAEQVALRIMEALAAPFELRGHMRAARASLGVAIAVADSTADDLVTNADAAMYVAKARGKGRYEIFEPTMRAHALERSGLRSDLEWALARDELVIHYQPVIDVAGGQVTGFEALLRWQHPVRGLLAPDAFIDLAESSGLIVDIGAWVLRTACQQSVAWQQTFPESKASMAVNLSARQLQQPHLVSQVAAILAETGIDPGRVVLEITESATVDDTEAAIEKLQELKTLGLCLAIDDFGTGYSSLSYLRRFPVDLLKVDRSFVAGLGHDTEDSAIVANVISLAHALGLAAVAEGVETVEQLEVLGELGCDLAQGYNWRRPTDVAHVEQWLTMVENVQSPTVPPQQQTQGVLLVDDRGGVRAAIRIALEMDGHFRVVAEAGDGEHAVKLARHHQPDLILLDLAMPGMGGMEALPLLHRAAPGAKVVLLTALEPVDVPDAILSQALGIFDKATDLSCLVDRLSNLVTPA